jgi:hypothetical protein
MRPANRLSVKGAIILLLIPTATPALAQGLWPGEIYDRCGKLASGVLIAKGKVECILDHSRCKDGAIASNARGEYFCIDGKEPEESKNTGSNKRINDLLNSADQARSTEIRCGYVALAAQAANTWATDGQQKAEIRRYAKQCNLRF